MRPLAFAFVCALLLSTGRADQPAPKPPTKADPKPAKVAWGSPEKWTVDDVLFTEKASDFEISPDGRWAVWIKSVMDRDKGERVGHLMRTDLAEKRDVQLTRGPDTCHDPKWSPDGKLLAFRSERPGPKSASKPKAARRGKDEHVDEPKTQLWLIDPTGGEPWRLTELPRSVTSYDWAGNDALVFVAQEEASLYERNKKDRKDATIVVEDEKHAPPARLFKVGVKSKKVTRLTDNADRIEWVAVSPDGRRAVTRHNRSLSYEYDNRVKPAYFLIDLAAGGRKPIFAEGKFNVSAVIWAPDSKGFYAANERNSHPQYAYPAITELYFFDLAAGTPAKIDLGWENGLAQQNGNDYAPGFAPTPDGFVALLADGARNKPARFTRADGEWRREFLTGDDPAHIFGLQTSRDGKALVFAHSTASSPIQWRYARLDGPRLEKPAPIAVLNEELRKRSTARTEVIHWKGALDEEVEGILYYPHDHKPGRKYPLVVMIHGGPAHADLDLWGDSWAYPANLFCRRGAFVLKPNYHGSSNYGLRFMESIAGGRYYELEVPDIEKGVDALIQKGLADPERLGVMGWSNGSILTIALTVHTTRYKAAGCGAGDVDWVSDWANCDFGASFDHFYLGKSPLQDPKLYLDKSPFYRLDRVRTPTIIFFGTEDRAVATEQGWMHYRALQQLGKTDVRFLLFPGEKHSPKKLVHQRRKLEEELAWFDKHLFASPPDKNEALKPDSPLDRALKRQAAKRTNGHYGVAVKGQIIPETVRLGGWNVGRFEVTNKQFAGFDPKRKPEPGREDYPASGVAFEEAQAYCRWLSELTGEKYRLPTEEEAEELYGATEAGENTLDYWAGYAVNPDDTARLRAKIKDLLGVAPLLKPVGSFRAAGSDAAVFDLGGNVAEWVVAKDGKGVLRGGSADQPADAKQAGSRAAPAYRGFRVVREGRTAE